MPEDTQLDAWGDDEALERQAGRKDKRDFSRNSKHAPTELSSKKAVSRRRDVIPVIKRVVRDPRFDPLGGPVNEAGLRKAYAFLDDYREAEMSDLRASIRKEKHEAEKDRLKRELLIMESQKKTQARKDAEAEVVATHRKQERIAVRQGKTPYFLKRPEIKKQVLTAEFGKMKGKERDKVIQRRRKKVEGKEKKKLPWNRRSMAE